MGHAVLHVDEELLIAMPDQARLSKIFMSSRRALMNFVSRIVPPKDIEDIVQETYIRACQAEQVNRIKQPRSFLLKTAKNLALDHVKRSEYRTTVAVDPEDPDELRDGYDGTDQTFNKIATDEEFALFCESVRYLPSQCRKAFILKKVYGFSQREIAVEMGISESTVEKHISTGIKRCTNFMTHQKDAGREEEVPNSRRQGDGP